LPSLTTNAQSVVIRSRSPIDVYCMHTPMYISRLLLIFFFFWSSAPLTLHSFPTRRSSDLQNFMPCAPPWKKPSVSCLPFCGATRSEEHTSELQSRGHVVCRLLLEKKKDPLRCPLTLILVVSLLSILGFVGEAVVGALLILQ